MPAEIIAVGLGGNVDGNNIEMYVKVGDEVIVEVAKALKSCLRKTDKIIKQNIIRRGFRL